MIFNGTHFEKLVWSGKTFELSPNLCLISAPGENVPTSLTSATRLPLTIRPNSICFITACVALT